MQNPDLIELTKEHLAAFCAGDWPRHRAGLAPDAVYVEKATGRTVQGADQYTAGVKGWIDAFPDMSITFNTVFACANSVVAEVTWQGTQTGPFTGPTGTIPATFKRGTLDAVLVITFDGDKIQELHQYFDLLTLLRTLGAVPAPALATAG